MDTVSPWKSIWVKPRETIRQIVASNPKQGLWAMAFIYGFGSILSVFQSLSLGDRFPLVLLFGAGILLAPLWGQLAFALWSWAIMHVSRWLKGDATFSAMRAAYAWASVPLVLNIPIWFFMGALFGRALFMAGTETIFLSGAQVNFLLALTLVKLGASVWSLVIYINALAEVSHFTVLRAIGAFLITGALILFVSMLLLYLGLAALGLGVERSSAMWQLLNDSRELFTR
jgi:hypothetical protein